jgi:integrase
LDNPLFSELTIDNGDATNGDVVIAKEIASAECAVTCTLEPGDAVRAYVEAGIAPATRRAYKADLEHFRAWGGDIPTTDIQLAAYLAEQATTLKVATLIRRLAAISIAHKAQRLPSPVSSPLVRATMRGVRREHGTAQRQAAPLLREDLFVVLGDMGDRLKDLRDRALLLVGFAGGLRRSELAAINLNDFQRVREGIVLTIRRSKTDQDGVGRKIGIPFGRTVHCPVRALEKRGGCRRRSRLPARRSTRACLGRSTLRRSRVLDCSPSDGRRRGRPYGVFWSQPARRLRDERDSGGCLHIQDQAADRALLRRHALPLRPGRGTLPRERCRHSPVAARMTCRLCQIGPRLAPTRDVSIAQIAVMQRRLGERDNSTLCRR